MATAPCTSSWAGLSLSPVSLGVSGVGQRRPASASETRTLRAPGGIGTSSRPSLCIERLFVKITHLRHFVAVAEQLHFVRAADSLGISRVKLDSSIQALETQVGGDLFDRDEETTTLTRAGRALLEQAYLEIDEFESRPQAPAAPAGGKAKASKGKGRAPTVKGEPRPYKNRQSR